MLVDVHIRGIRWPVQNLDITSCEKILDYSGSMRASVILLENPLPETAREVGANPPHHGLSRPGTFPQSVSPQSVLIGRPHSTQYILRPGPA